MTDAPRDAIAIDDAPDPALAARLDEEIAAFNFDATGIRDARDFGAAVHDDDGTLLAGVQGWMWGATCWVERLWVRTDARHRGVGTDLLMAVVSEARARGCAQLALTTHTFQALTSIVSSDSRWWASWPTIRPVMRL
jgi:GNAT superfamily N-acetyltransferase